jgi:hypothetical protein
MTAPDDRRRPTPFVVLLLALCAVGGLRLALSLQGNGVIGPVLFAPAGTVRAALGASDAGSYLQAGIDLAARSISDEGGRIFRLWAPGMFVVHGLAVLSGLPVVPVLAATAVLVWAVPAALVGALLMSHGRRSAAVLLLGIWTLSPLASGWVLSAGALYSEPWAISALGVALFAIHAGDRAAHEPDGARLAVVRFALAGTALAAFATFRSAGLPALALVIVLAGGAGCGILAARAVPRLRRRGARTISEDRERRPVPAATEVRAIGLVVLAASVLVGLLPWVAFRIAIDAPITRDSNPINASDYMWSQRWLTDDQLTALGADFLVDGDANWACDLDPIVCAELNPIAVRNADDDFARLREATIEAARTRPLAFTMARARTFASGWTSTPGGSVGAHDARAYGVATLVAAVAAAGMAVRRRRVLPITGIAAPVLILGTLAPLALTHLETRYLLPAQALIWLWLGLLIATPRTQERTAA